MSVTFRTRQMLWGRAAGKCAFPKCRIDCVESESATDDPTTIGENCHIIASADNGPRGDPSFDQSKRDLYNNLVLLCRNHHRIVDTQTIAHGTEQLRTYKRDHERWVREQLSTYDAEFQRQREEIASIVDRWASDVELDDWRGWMGWVISFGQPRINREKFETLHNVGVWLLGRHWPENYPEVRRSLKNFADVANDFRAVFARYSEPFGEDTLITRKFYRISEWDEARYAKLARQYEDHVAVVENYALELTRAANFVIKQVRNSIDPAYRSDEGVALIDSGPYEDLSIRTHRVEYDGLEEKVLYPGLEQFDTVMSERSFHYPRVKV